MGKFSWIVVAMLLRAASSDGVDKPTPPPFEPPVKPDGDVYFAESFSDAEETWKLWIRSEATKDGGEAKYDGENPFQFWCG